MLGARGHAEWRLQGLFRLRLAAWLPHHDPDGRLSLFGTALSASCELGLPPDTAQAGYLALPLKDRRLMEPTNTCARSTESLHGTHRFDRGHRCSSTGGAFTCLCESHTRSMRLTTSRPRSAADQNMCSSFTGQGSVPHMAWVTRGWCSGRLEVIDEAFDRIDRFPSRI